MAPLTHDQVELLSVYGRCKINNDVYTSELYTRQNVRLNSFVSCDDKTLFGQNNFFFKIGANYFYILRQFVELRDPSDQIIQREIGFDFSTIFKPVRETYATHVIPVESIKRKVIRVKNYFCFLQNDVERK